MNKLWSDIAWDEYLYWQQTDKKIVKKINELINVLSQGIGHPEPLRYRKGWSRHIDHGNRIVYNIVDGNLWIASCKGHYED